MSPDLDKKLCEKYPKIFRDRQASKAKTAMCWGFECGDGWFNIIDALCAELKDRNVVATQVKEKFGSLRFYYDGGDEECYCLISLAERLSEVTCEVCGKPGEIDNNAGWLKCLCPEHGEDKP